MTTKTIATHNPLIVRGRMQGEVIFEGVPVRARVFLPAPARDPEQAWFWTDRWQAMEAEVDEHVRHGRVERFDDVEAFLASLTDSEGTHLR